MSKIGVIFFPGSNCDNDAVKAIKYLYPELSVEKLWHHQESIQDFAGIIVPGGFSYGDYLRSGAIASHSPIMKAVKSYASNGGPVLGICNGFQILCEAGLLPGALLPNQDGKFICQMVQIESKSKISFATAQMPKRKLLNIPIAHMEGRYHIDPDAYQQLISKDQIAFSYSVPYRTSLLNSNSFQSWIAQKPVLNPNGSYEAIAGVTNEAGNVTGLMPHPERAVEKVTGSEDGQLILKSFVDSALNKLGAK